MLNIIQLHSFACSAAPDDYLARYSDDDFTEITDPGNRCGYSDQELEEVERRLHDRGLCLQADDEGLVIKNSEEN